MNNDNNKKETIKIYPDGGQGSYHNQCIHCNEWFIGYKNDPDCGKDHSVTSYSHCIMVPRIP